MYNIHNDAIQWQIHDFLPDTIVNFVLSLIIFEIFANRIKCQKFNLESDCQSQGGEKWDLRHLTGNAQIYIGDFFHNFSTWEHTFMKNW